MGLPLLMVEHDWRELYVLEDDPRGSGMPHPEPGDVDRCSKCGVLRVAKKVRFMPYLYLDPRTFGRVSSNELICEEGS